MRANKADWYPIPSPPLATGDRLDAEDYLRRYDATHEKFKAELIDGVVFVAPAVTGWRHGRAVSILCGWIGTHEVATPATDANLNPTIEIDARRVPQPELAFVCLPPRPAQTRLGPRDRPVGCPELAVEVADGTARLDRGRKRRMYERAGAQEYLVWDVRRRAATWLTRAGSALIPLEPDAAGVIRSRAFPGLWLDARALAGGDGRAVIDRLRAGLAPPDHAAFAAAGRG